jgi:hypothetical protein
MYSDEVLKKRIQGLAKQGIANLYSRKQGKLAVKHLFPYDANKHECRCGCGQHLGDNPRRRWASAECQSEAMLVYWTVKGVSMYVRWALFKRDGEICANCKCDVSNPDLKHTPNYYDDLGIWDADHITPIRDGGGASLLDNYQILCESCHNDKTNAEKQKHRKLNRKKQKLAK